MVKQDDWNKKKDGDDVVLQLKFQVEKGKKMNCSATRMRTVESQ